jgi:opacity protein-like surface antigen
MHYCLRIPLTFFNALAMLIIFTGQGESAFLGDTLKPFVTLGEIYDSNVFRVKERSQLPVGDEQLDDFITMVTVGTELHYSISREELDLLLKRDFIYYKHYTDQNADQNEVSGKLALILFDKVKMRIDGSYKTYPEGHAYYQNNAVNEEKDSTYGVSLGYEMPTGIGYEAAYRRAEVDYSLAEYVPNEYSINTFSGTMSYRLSADARIYAAYLRDDTGYKEDMPIGSTLVNNNSVADSMRLGLEKTVSPKTAITCYVGFLDRRHNQAPERDFSGMIGKVAATYGVTGKLGLILDGERQIYEETWAYWNYSVTNFFGIGLNYEITKKTKATFYNRLSWKDFQDIPGAGVGRRSDFMHDMKIVLEWAPMTGLTVDLGYQYSTQSSNYNIYNFADQTVRASVGYKF